MLRVTTLTILSFFVLTPAIPAQADWHTFWNRVDLDWHRNNCWPDPFQPVDRRTVCTTFSMQIATGWKRQNTLSEVYFDPDTQVLNESGRRKVWAILNATPDEYRAIYVVQSMNAEAQERRIDSVRQTIGKLTDGPIPEVHSVKIPPRSWSADFIDAIGRKVQSSLPSPVLPEFQDTTSN